MIRTFLTKLFQEDALENQMEYLESARCPGDMTPENCIKRIIHIIKCLILYEVGTTNYSNKEHIKRSLLKISLVKSESNSFPKEVIKKQIWTRSRVSSTLAQKQLQFKRNMTNSRSQRTKAKSGKKKGDQSNSREKADKTNTKPNLCRKRNGKHEWKDCPQHVQS